MKSIIRLFMLILIIACPINLQARDHTVLMPDQIYGEFFDAVQMQDIFPNNEILVDDMLKSSSQIIIHNYSLFI